MKTNYPIIISLTILLGIFSCQSQTKSPETEKILDQLKADVNINVDSANYYIDAVLADNNKGIAKEEIERKYGSHSNIFLMRVNIALDKVHQLGEDGKLSRDEYDKWINQFESALTPFREKSKRVKQQLGIDLNKVFVSTHHDLTQTHSDKQNHFSIRLPKDWEILESNSYSVLRAAGPTINNPQSTMQRAGMFSVNIDQFKVEHDDNAAYRNQRLKLSAQDTSFKGYNIVEAGNLDLNGIEAKYVVVEYTMDGTRNAATQVYFVKGRQGVWFNGGSTYENFHEYRDLYIEIARSFKWE